MEIKISIRIDELEKLIDFWSKQAILASQRGDEGQCERLNDYVRDLQEEKETLEKKNSAE